MSTEAETQYVPSPMAAPFISPRDQYGSSIILLTNPENEIDKLKLTFKNVELDKDGNIKSCGEPLMNDFGINSVCGTIQSVVSQNTIFSNFDDNKVKNIMTYLAYVLAKDLMVNRTTYGIDSFAARSKIYFSALYMAYSTMLRAKEDGLSDKKFWRGSVQELHSRIEQPQKKGGFLSSLWKK